MEENPEFERIEEFDKPSQLKPIIHVKFQKKVANFIWYIIGIAVIIFILRFGLALLGSGFDNSFADFIYKITDPVVTPVHNLFQSGQINIGKARIEFEAIIIIAALLLIGKISTYLITTKK